MEQEPADSTEHRRAERLLQVLRSDRCLPGWFSPVFLAAIELRTLSRMTRALRDRYGPPVRVERRGASWEATLASAVVPVDVSWDGEERLTGLRLGPAEPSGTTLEMILAELVSVAQEVGYLIIVGDEERWARAPDRRVQVASAFKLAVLAALREEIEAGRRSWQDVTCLREDLRSLPTGVLQDWPAGAPLTLHTLATLMIAHSDNTAADLLIDLLGRPAVEAVCPGLFPLVTTREYFVLAAPSNRGLRERFRAEDTAGRRRILEEARARALPAAGETAADDPSSGLGWRLSPRELCALMARVADLPLMGVEPGPARWGAWQRAGFKGGATSSTRSCVLGLQSDGRACYVATVAQGRVDAARADVLSIRLARALEATLQSQVL